MTIAGELLLPVLPDTKGFGKDLAKDLDKEVDRNESKFGKSFGKIGKLAVAGLATAGIAAGAALMKGFSESLQIESANDLLSAQLRLTEGESKRVGKIAGDLYAGAYGDSLAEVNSAIRGVSGQMGDLGNVSDEELSRAATKALDLATILETDVTRVSQVAGQAVKNGLAADMDEAFDLIAAASAETMPGLQEDVLDAVDEYGTFFAQLGLDGPRAFGLLAEGSERGQYGIDKMGDAIKEFTIRSTDMSKASQEAYDAIGLDSQDMAEKVLAGGDSAAGAFDEIVAGLLGIKDPVAQSNAAIALFGTPLEDLSTGEIPQFLTSLTDAESGLRNVGGAADEMGATLNDNAAVRVESFKRQTLQGLTDFMGNNVIPAFEKVSPVVRDVFGGAFTQAKALVEPFLPVLDNLVSQIPNLLGAITDGDVQGIAEVIDNMLGNTGALVTPIRIAAETAMAVVSNVREGIAAASSLISGNLTATGDRASWFSERFQAVWAQVKTKVLDPLGPLFEAAFGYAQAIIETVTKVATNLWDRFGSDLIDKAKTALNIIRETFTKVFNSILDIFQGVIQTFTGIFNAFSAIFRGDWKGFTEAIRQVWDGLWRTATAILRAAFEVIKGVFRASINALSLLWEAFSDGVRAVFGFMWNALKTAASAGWQNLKDQWTQSVARVRDIWTNYITGLRDEWQAFWVRIRDITSAAWNAVRDMFATYVASLYAAWMTFTGRLRDTWTNFWDGIRTTFDNKWAALRGSFDAATNILAGAWLGFTDRIKTGWSDLWDGIKEGFGSIRSGMESMVQGLVDSVANIWDGIRNVLAKPIRWVQDKIINGFIGAVNKVSNALGGDNLLEPIPLVPEYHTGGIAGAGTRMRDLGRSPLRSDEEMAVLRKGERVLNPEETDAFEQGGTTEGGGSGGGMSWKHLAAMIGAAGIPHRITSAYRPGSQTASGNKSYHASGNAIDQAGPSPSSKPSPAMDAIFGFWAPYYKNLKELIYAGADQNVKNGRWVAPYATSIHQDHVHTAALLGSISGAGPDGDLNITGAGGGGGGLGSLFDPVDNLIKKFISPITGLLDKIPGSDVVAELLKSAGKKMIDSGIEGLKQKVGGLFGGDVEGGTIAQTILAVARGVGASARATLASFETALVESGMKNVPYGDRDSLGVFQQRAAWGSAEDRMNPAWAALAFFRGGEGGQRGALEYDARGTDYKGRKIVTAGQLAQATQVSAFPDRYDQREGDARSILRSLGASFDRGGLLQPGFTPAFNGTGQPELVTAIDVLDDALLRAVNANGGGGPIMNIEHYEAHEQADIDALADRLAFRLEPVLG